MDAALGMVIPPEMPMRTAVSLPQPGSLGRRYSPSYGYYWYYSPWVEGGGRPPGDIVTPFYIVVTFPLGAAPLGAGGGLGPRA